MRAASFWAIVLSGTTTIIDRRQTRGGIETHARRDQRFPGWKPMEMLEKNIVIQGYLINVL